MKIEVEITNHDVLSKKEESVFQLLAQGMSYSAIAEQTHRSEETVKSQAKAIREKLHASSIVQAVAIAIANGIISIKGVGAKGLFAILLTFSATFFGDENNHLRNQRISRPTVTRTREV
jgi:DNA-binding CsgD family transcriptional regulator